MPRIDRRLFRHSFPLSPPSSSSLSRLLESETSFMSCSSVPAEAEPPPARPWLSGAMADAETGEQPFLAYLDPPPLAGEPC